MKLLLISKTASKAIAGFIAATVLTYLAKHGFDANMTVGEAVNSLVYGAVGFVTVWLAPKNK